MANLLQVILRVTGQNNAGGALTGLNQGLELVQAGVQALNQTVGEFIRQGVAMDAMLETSQLQFKTLMGSADLAQEHVRQLFDIAAHTPFTFESVVQASRQLEVFGGGALDTRANLILLGDAAAATGADITQVTFWTSRLYSELQGGRPIGESARWLQQMGVLSGQARTQLEDMQAAGKSGNAIWQAYAQSLQQFSGAMKEQEGTWVGLTSTMQDNLKLLAGATTRDSFRELEEAMKAANAQLQDEHTQQAAQHTSEALGLVTHEGIRAAGTLLSLGTLAIQAAPGVLQLANAYLALRDAKRAALGEGPADTGPDPQTDLENARVSQLAYQDALRRRQAATDDAAASQVIDNRVLGAAAASADGASRAIDSLTAAHAALRDESARAAAQQPILDQQRNAAHQAEMDQLRQQGEALLQQQNIRDIVDREQVAAAAFRQQQQEQATKDAERQAEEQRQANERAAQQTQAAWREAEQERAEEARTASEAVIRALDSQMDAERRRHDETLAHINAEEDAQLGALRSQMDALDKQRAARRDAQQDKRDSEALRQAQKDLVDAQVGGDPEQIARAQKALRDVQDSIAQTAQDRRDQAERAALQQRMDAVRQQADAQKQAEDRQTQAVQQGIQARQQAERQHLQDYLAQLQQQTAAGVAAAHTPEQAAVAAASAIIAASLRAYQASANAAEQSAQTQVAALGTVTAAAQQASSAVAAAWGNPLGSGDTSNPYGGGGGLLPVLPGHTRQGYQFSAHPFVVPTVVHNVSVNVQGNTYGVQNLKDTINEGLNDGSIRMPQGVGA